MISYFEEKNIKTNIDITAFSESVKLAAQTFPL
jgi:hypothetical protein